MTLYGDNMIFVLLMRMNVDFISSITRFLVWTRAFNDEQQLQICLNTCLYMKLFYIYFNNTNQLTIYSLSR